MESLCTGCGEVFEHKQNCIYQPFILTNGEVNALIKELKYEYINAGENPTAYVLVQRMISYLRECDELVK